MQKVAKSARCPVAIISRPCTTCWKLFSNIVFGTDFSKASDSAFMFASKLAKEVGANLHIFHAVDISQSDEMSIKDQEEIESKIATAQEKIYTQYLSKLKDFNSYDVAIWEGTPYVEILKFARDKSADLIVMAHHTREINPEKALLGSTVEQVVLRSACPVASVNHPDKVVMES
jgi:nucleotide-binding universal stress UspA family protein